MKCLFMFIFLSYTVLCSGVQFDASNISEITPEKLEPLLIEKPRGFGQPITDRVWWNRIRHNVGEGKIAKLKAYIKKKKAANKINVSNEAWEKSIGADKSLYSTGKILILLDRLMLLEALENKGENLPEIKKWINFYLDLRTWVGPMHDKKSYAYNGRGRYCDLGAGHISFVMAQAVYLLGEKLSSECHKRIREKVAEWVFNPYLESIKHGKPIYGMHWVFGKNNWTASCGAHTAAAAGMLLNSKHKRAVILANICKSLQGYISGFSDDGYCSEGASYWFYGFGRYLIAAEILYIQTNGQVDLYNGTEKLKNIELYISRLDMNHELFPAFADCPVNVYYRKITCSALFLRCGLKVYKKFSMTKNNYMPWQPLDYVTRWREMETSRKHKIQTVKEDVNGWHFKDGGIVISKPLDRNSDNSLSLAVKAGNNGEFHNHNDIGSFVVALGKKSIITDPGYPVYLWKSFSSERYASDACNSYGHPVPIINGILQGAGNKYYGTITSYNAIPEQTTVTIDMKTAYPEQCNLKQLIRTIVHNKKSQTVTLTDDVEFFEPGSFRSALLTYGTITHKGPNHYTFTLDKSVLNVTFNYSKKQTLTYSTSELNADFLKQSRPTRFEYKFDQRSKYFKVSVVIKPGK